MIRSHESEEARDIFIKNKQRPKQRPRQRMLEKYLWRMIRENTSVAIDWCREENVVAAGMPDVNGCRHGVDIWLELKIFGGNKIHFRPSQPSWIRRRCAHGGRVWIVAWKEPGVLYLYNGNVLKYLLASGVAAIDDVPNGTADVIALDRLATLQLSVPVDWQKFERTIFGDTTECVSAENTPTTSGNQDFQAA